MQNDIINEHDFRNPKIDIIDKSIKETEKRKEILNTISINKTNGLNSRNLNVSIDAEINTAIQEEIKNSDIREQNKNQELPDTPREASEKEAILRNEKNLNRPGNLNTNEIDKFVIPANIVKQYVISTDNKTFFDKKTNVIAIQIAFFNKELKTKNNDQHTIYNMMALAKANNWQSIKVNGSKEFRREAWKQAKIAGFLVKGYTPTAEEKKFIEAKLAQTQKKHPEMEQKESKINTMEAKKETLVNAFKTRASALMDYVANRKDLKPEQRKIEIKEKYKEKEKELEK